MAPGTISREERLEVRLGAERVGLRIDRALLSALQELGHALTRSRLTRAFAAGEVCVQDRPVKPGATLERPMVLQVRLPVPEPLSARPEPVPLEIVFEDASLLVVDKPAGMVVHPGPGHATGSLVAGVLHHLRAQPDELPVLPGNDATRPGIVHRIDKDTSGLVVIAKTVAAQTGLAAQFAAHTLERSYLSILTGEPDFERRTVQTTHARDPSDRRRFAPVVGARRRATSEVEVLEQLQGAALARWRLHTGRTHQIRMHARSLGHPVFGDDLYGRPPRDEPRKSLWRDLGRHALHAATLGFSHPVTGGQARFESPLPAELVALLQRLGHPGGRR